MIIKPPFKLFNQDFSGEVKELVLAYPRGIQYSGLTLNRLYEFYREYLQLIPNYITIIWIIKENKINTIQFEYGLCWKENNFKLEEAFKLENVKRKIDGFYQI